MIGNRLGGKPGIWVCVLMMLSLPLAGQNEEVLKKLQEFEERLKRLESAGQQQEAAKAEKPQAGNGQQQEGGNGSGTARQDQKTVQVEELRRQLDILAEELEKVRSGEAEIEVSARQAQGMGLGPSAASVYRRKQGVSIAGYGEMVYQNFENENESGAPVNIGSQLDFVRAIVYAGYRFNDKFLFNSELEFEHAATDKTGSVSVEFAYLDYLATDNLTLRGGLLLVPMGLVNEFHEPNVFIGALRPQTEQRIIPSTWRENGFGITGSAGLFDYRAYVVNGLDAAGFSSNGLRGGRQKGSRAKATDLAFVGRLDVHPTPGVFFGGSLYRGGSGQGQFELNGRELDVTTTIGEVHGQVQVKGFDVRGLYARATVDDAAELSQLLNLSSGSPVAETLQGGYLQFGYNLLTRTHDTSSLMPFYRFEALNTQEEVPAGFTANLARDRTFHTLGLEFKPIRNIVLKADYQWLRNEAESGVNQFNLGLGYSF